MTFAKITITALITVLASVAMADSYCPHKDRSGLFANTNPAPVVKVVKTNTQGAVR